MKTHQNFYESCRNFYKWHNSEIFWINDFNDFNFEDLDSDRYLFMDLIRVNLIQYSTIKIFNVISLMQLR